MPMVKKSQYIKVSKTIVQKLASAGCWGTGTLYEDNLKKGIKEEGDVIDRVIKALYKQKIILPLKHKFGKKWFLNKERRDKIGEILKEKPRKRNSILLLLFGV